MSNWYLGVRQVETSDSDGWYVSQEISCYAEIINNLKAQWLIIAKDYFSLIVLAHFNICAVLYVIFT